MEKEYGTVREMLCAREEKTLSPYAVLSANTKGRAREEKPCDFRTEFQRDRDRIIYSNSFKRLKNKTQVFCAPEGDHYMTRLTHTFDVSQIARSIARTLRLNEDLSEAIALGHDLGHTPFGHVGEKVLNEISSCGFEHNEQSVRVVDVIEKNGRGLNLTVEVRDGIMEHKSSGKPATLEGQAVSLADRIAYINHDIEDAIGAGMLKEEDLPRKAVEVLGNKTKVRINTAISDIWKNSYGKPYVKMSDEVMNATNELRAFMFKNVYGVTNKSMQDRASRMLTQLFEYFMKHVEKLPKPYYTLLDNDDKERVVCDYLSGMTDRYALTYADSL
jgi:dGTPase